MKNKLKVGGGAAKVPREGSDTKIPVSTRVIPNKVNTIMKTLPIDITYCLANIYFGLR